MKAKCISCEREFDRPDRRTKVCDKCRPTRAHAIRRKWYASNRSERRMKAKAWRDRNRKRIREYDKMYRIRRKQREALEKALDKIDD